MNRFTLCNRFVDETTEEQRASHKLREASFCSKCSVRLQGQEVEACFTTYGERRHYTLKQ